MKKSFIFLVFLFILTVLAIGQTFEYYEGDVINSNVTWYQDTTGHVMINGKVTIAQNVTVTIEPGTFVEMKAGSNFTYGTSDCGFLIVEGTLIAQGTSSDRITIGQVVGDFGVILITPTAGPNTIFEYCNIYGGKYISYYFPSSPDHLKGALTFDSNMNSIEVNNCYIKNSEGAGVFILDSDVTIENSQININQEGIIVDNSSTIPCEIIHNVISNSEICGLNLYDTGPTNVYKNSIFGSDLNGIIVNSGCGSEVKLVNNLVKENTYSGIRMFNNSSPMIINNTIADNDYNGIRISSYNCNSMIRNNIFWGNSSKSIHKSISGINPTAGYNLFAESSSAEFSNINFASGNIFGDNPDFIGGNASPYALQSISPAIDEGDYSLVIAINQTNTDIRNSIRVSGATIDMGAYEYYQSSSGGSGGQTKKSIGKEGLNLTAITPFNPVTTISYNLSEAADVRLTVFNIKGQVVETLVNEYQSSGAHSITWNAENTASGIYFCKIEAGNKAEMKKMILMK